MSCSLTLLQLLDYLIHDNELVPVQAVKGLRALHQVFSIKKTLYFRQGRVKHAFESRSLTTVDCLTVEMSDQTFLTSNNVD